MCSWAGAIFGKRGCSLGSGEILAEELLRHFASSGNSRAADRDKKRGHTKPLFFLMLGSVAQGRSGD